MGRAKQLFKTLEPFSRLNFDVELPGKVFLLIQRFKEMTNLQAKMGV